jgi:hypothetical protein
MSYLRLEKDLDLLKATISVWFRVPQTSADACRAATPPSLGTDFNVMYGVIPFITWGKGLESTVYDYGQKTFNDGPMPADPVFGGGGGTVTPEVVGGILTGSHPAWHSPSFIGVHYDGYLVVHIQTADHPTGSGLNDVMTGVHWVWTFPGQGWHLVGTYEDTSYTELALYDFFGNAEDGGAPSIGGFDKWHHLLLSWELLAHSNSQGASKMWCSIDDVSKSGHSDLPAMCDPSLQGGDPNGHRAFLAFRYTYGLDAGPRDPPEIVNFNPTNVPSNPLTIPCPPEVFRGQGETFNPTQMVELAELQIFCGKAFDASNAGIRRNFIASEGIGGGKLQLKPVDPETAEKALGRPDILLHGSSNWKVGKNTGSIGITKNEDGDDEEIEAGQFKRTGTINKYDPDPSVEETSAGL